MLPVCDGSVKSGATSPTLTLPFVVELFMVLKRMRLLVFSVCFSILKARNY